MVHVQWHLFRDKRTILECVLCFYFIFEEKTLVFVTTVSASCLVMGVIITNLSHCIWLFFLFTMGSSVKGGRAFLSQLPSSK